MATPSKDVLKTYAVVGLGLVFVAIGYFRFFHKKAPGAGGTSTVGAVHSAILPGTLRVPDIRSRRQGLGETNGAGPRVVMRDIFTPPVPIKPKEPVVVEVDPAEQAPKWVLAGVIRSGNRLIANINNRLLGVGETIAGFQVAEITPRHVTLRSATQTIVLQLTAPVPGVTHGRGVSRL
jgi:hypothetical protein